MSPRTSSAFSHVRPKMSCRACETIVQALMPTLPIEKGSPGPALLAHVIVSKYCDHLPLHRQSDIYAREGVEIDRSVMAGWVGHMAALLEPLERASIGKPCARRGHPSTPTTRRFPCSIPGAARRRPGDYGRRCATSGRLGSTAPAAAFYLYSPDRKAEHARALLEHPSRLSACRRLCGLCRALSERDPRTGAAAPLTEGACWAHARRYIYDVHVATQSPAAEAALAIIARLFAIEADISGK